MDADPVLGDDGILDWNSDDEREINDLEGSSSSGLSYPSGESRASYAEMNDLSSPVLASSSINSPGSKFMDHFVGMGFSREVVAEAIQENGEENTDLVLEALLKKSKGSSAGSSGTKVIDQFVGMGFPEAMVIKVIEENGEENTDSILETLLTYKDPMQPEADEESTLPFLVNMGYTRQEASLAIERCGPDATVCELTDFICAAQMAKEADAFYPEEKPKPKLFGNNLLKHKKRNHLLHDMLSRKRQKFELSGDDEPLRLANPMIGFGVPNESGLVTHRSLPEGAMGPPYFYYENVALAPKGVWNTISRFLYDVEPEFVDSKYFCAAARKRGYVHNLPIHNRFPLLPLQPLTIRDALPMTRKWWPSWDPRTKLNCLQTCIGSAKLTERIRKALAGHEENPPPKVQEFVLHHCRKWNLVWVGRNKVAPLEADEVETLLGFPRNHTRGGGISRTDRYKALGNSFQVDTVAYHLSVLREMFPEGMNLLSLFSGIGGAEVALHRLGIRLKTVVSVEISKESRAIMKSWWEQTNQTGNLIDIEDVQGLDEDRLKELMDRYGDFDLVVGGSPCNNLTGSNRHHRDGLEGKESALFYYFYWILDWVRNIVRERRSKT